MWPRCKKAQLPGRPCPTPYCSVLVGDFPFRCSKPHSCGLGDSECPAFVYVPSIGCRTPQVTILAVLRDRQPGSRAMKGSPVLQRAHGCVLSPRTDTHSSGKQPHSVQREKGLGCSRSLGAPSSHSQSARSTSWTPHSLPDRGLQKDSGEYFLWLWLKPQKSHTDLRQQTCFPVVLRLSILLSEQ